MNTVPVKNGNGKDYDIVDVNFKQVFGFLFKRLEELSGLIVYSKNLEDNPNDGFELECPLVHKAMFLGINPEKQLVFAIFGKDNGLRIVTVNQYGYINYETSRDFSPLTAKSILLVLSGALIHEITWEKA
ncbi:MAG: hypothetical protein Q8P32_04950 [Candidatus Komeilibacteria bacterium]|nr:hypothetical protein [Candidatus Komeilibacteria bacterium]